MPVQVLEDEVIARIAAGEVVERPSSVVRELVDNALDAEASRIDLRVEAGGRKLVEVSDNGHGIPAAELELALQRHATSKLVSAADLECIRTLGFRGEALASIAAVSRMHISSRIANAQTGAAILLEAGEILQRELTGIPPGTTVSVQNLFHNVPARLKFLKAPLTEKRHITRLVSRYALAWPRVRFTLEHDGRESFRSNGNGSLADVLAAALGRDVAREMVPLNSGAPGETDIRVSGYVSAPALHRGNRSHIFLYVNGRYIQDSSLAFAVIQTYHTLLMKGRFPIAVLNISLPPDQLDVNVHPAKSEVRFQRPRAVFSAVQRAVRNALQAEAGVLTGVRPDMIRHPSNDEVPPFGEVDSWPAASRSTLFAEDDTILNVDASPPRPQRPRTLPMLRVIGQLGASFIVAEGPAGMYLIDQHAAHERILYEQFLERKQSDDVMSQFALAAQTLELSASEAALIEANLEQLHALGFEVEPFGPNSLVIRSIPSLLARVEPREALRNVIEELERGLVPGEITLEQRLIRRVCKQAAVRAGTVLSREEMQGLVSQLERTGSPLTCPHGRPTLLHMSSGQLTREFGRR